MGLFQSGNGVALWQSSSTGVPEDWRNTVYWLAFDLQVKGLIWGAFSGVHDLPRAKDWENAKSAELHRRRGCLDRWRLALDATQSGHAVYIGHLRRAESARSRARSLVSFYRQSGTLGPNEPFCWNQWAHWVDGRIKGYSFKWGHRVILDPTMHQESTSPRGGVWHGPVVGDPKAQEDVLTPIQSRIDLNHALQLIRPAAVGFAQFWQSIRCRFLQRLPPRKSQIGQLRDISHRKKTGHIVRSFKIAKKDLLIVRHVDCSVTGRREILAGPLLHRNLIVANRCSRVANTKKCHIREMISLIPS